MSLHFAHSINVEPVKFKPIEDAVHKISLKKLLWKIPRNLQENTLVGNGFLKLQV